MEVDEGAQSPSGKGLKGGGIPPIPLFSRGRTGVMGRHVIKSIRRGTGHDSLCLQLVLDQRWRTPCQWYRKRFMKS